MSSRSLMQRGALLLALLMLSAWLFYIGKAHTLLIDTNAVTLDGREFKSGEAITVSVDGKAPEDMGRAERILVLVAGQEHTIAIEVVSGGERKIEKRFRVPLFMDSALVSIPAMLGDAAPEHWVTQFAAADREDAPAEQMQHEGDAAQPAPPDPKSLPLKP
jgi:hypothetical protein